MNTAVTTRVLIASSATTAALIAVALAAAWPMWVPIALLAVLTPQAIAVALHTPRARR